MYKILIIEDDSTIAKIVQQQLQSWGYQAEIAKHFQDIMPEWIQFAPQLVLLDISLPYFNGFHWCQEIRKLSKVPVVFLSSASDNMNMVMAMNMGADDFIAKPFDISVLVAKIQALLRRTYEFEESSHLLEYQGAILNRDDGVLHYGEKSVALTKNEYRILKTLMEQQGKTVSREKIMQQLWESDSYIDDNTLTVNVTRLRKKLEEIELGHWIQTKKGEGYIIK